MPNVPRLGRESNRTRYVVGFAFNAAGSRVALMQKARGPLEMTGTLNGIGGEASGRETYRAAMRREFLEEAGVVVSAFDVFAIIEADTWRLFVFRARLDDRQWRRIRTGPRSLTDEPIVRVSALHLPGDSYRVYHDVRWLVPMALDLRPGVVARVDLRGI
jgi:8-oxo-dGTP pyrophosphatase MutT (NUDIX family)